MSKALFRQDCWYRTVQGELVHVIGYEADEPDTPYTIASFDGKQYFCHPLGREESGLFSLADAEIVESPPGKEIFLFRAELILDIKVLAIDQETARMLAAEMLSPRSGHEHVIIMCHQETHIQDREGPEHASMDEKENR
ncbi:hypothetical protein [Thermosporothrix hazakensis]|nr:hypothetical protein [Thermosporothrix hazakensis]GCE49231.1 hypothetical protein KTH_41000 [Thermosporothrix hazakensis]